MSNPTRKLQRASTVAASRALVTDSNSKATTSAVTSTEIGYLSGVTSAIQTQLDSKSNLLTYVVSATTNDATQTELLKQGGSQLVVPRFTTWHFNALVSCRRDLIGESWTSVESSASRGWGICISSDGESLASSINGGQIYTSTDGGSSWTARASNQSWRELDCSDDFTKLFAVPETGNIYTSSDSGATWTARDSSRSWMGISCSSDGTKAVAVVNGGNIYTSTDSGATWTARDSSRTWSGVACSNDGTKAIASVPGGNLYVSTDSGVTWTAKDSSRNWYGVASSSTGVHMAAVGSSIAIYLSSGSEAEHFEVKSSVKRDSSYASASVLETQLNPLGTPANSVDIGVDTSTGAVKVLATGQANEQWQWKATVSINQLTSS